MGVRGGTSDARLGRRGTKGGPEAWDPPSAHPASPRPPPRPRPAASPAVAAPSCLAPHIWRAARSLPVAPAAWREVKITLPLPLPAGADGGSSRPGGGRGRAAAGERSPPEAASRPSHCLGVLGGGAQGGGGGGTDPGLREGAFGPPETEGTFVPRPRPPTPSRRGCASSNLLVDCNRHAWFPSGGVTHNYIDDLPKALWASVYPSVKWDNSVHLEVLLLNIISSSLFPIPGEAGSRGLETFEYSCQIKHKTPSYI